MRFISEIDKKLFDCMFMVNMRRFFVTVLLSTLVLCSLVHLKLDVRADPRIIEVPFDFPTIQAAINNASEGETVFVYNGTYYENLVVNKSISLVGQDESITMIDGGGFGTVLEVTANNVSITGFTVQNSGSSAAGISVSTNNVSVKRNIVLNNHFGIYLVNAAEAMIGNCNILTNYVGLQLGSSQSNTVEGNNITGNDLRLGIISKVFEKLLKRQVALITEANYLTKS